MDQQPFQPADKRNSSNEPRPDQASQTASELKRRAILEWTLPVVAGIFALGASPAVARRSGSRGFHDDHNDNVMTHTDNHSDMPHSDLHEDQGSTHSDLHEDVPSAHADGANHIDTHWDYHDDHSDGGVGGTIFHVDSPHSDHDDTTGPVHDDIPIHWDHDDAAHADELHQDQHFDSTGQHVDSHQDITGPHDDLGSHVDSHADWHQDHIDMSHLDHADSHADIRHDDRYLIE